jgi:hypothetical protein
MLGYESTMRPILALTLLTLSACPSTPKDSQHDTVPVQDTAPVGGDPGVVGVIPLLEIERLDVPGTTMGAAYGWGPMDLVPAWQRWGEVWEYSGEILLEEGECALVDSWAAGYCPDGCADDEYCAPTDACEPWWTQLDPGALTVEGPTLSLQYQTVSGLLSPEGSTDDLFQPGDEVALSATGAQTPAFSTSALAPAPLVSTMDCAVEPSSGQDYELSWEPVSAPGTVTLEIIAVYHAGNGAMVRCDSPEDGSIVVPAAIIDAYLPSRTPAEVIQITRWTEGRADLGDDRAFALRLGSQQACY